jgi:glutamine synthetase adenylyltransferase
MDNPSNQGYDINVEAKLAMMGSAFKQARGEDKKKIFAEALRMAKQNGMKELKWDDTTIPIDLAEHTARVSQVAQDATHVAQAQSQYINKSQATMHDEPKGLFEMKQLFQE